MSSQLSQQRLSEDEQRTLASILSTFRDPDSVLAMWRAQDMFQEIGSDGIAIATAPAAGPPLDALVARYEAPRKRAFPVLLRAFLEVHDGYSIEETNSGRAEIATDKSLDFIWNGLHPARLIELEEASDGIACLRIGTAYAQARVLLVDDGPRIGQVLVDDGKGPAVVVASSVADFFEALVTHGMSIESIFEGRG